ncbi:MAG: sigma-70 family RNA polymerase sigma factor [Planctomycetota bacterium]
MDPGESELAEAVCRQRDQESLGKFLDATRDPLTRFVHSLMSDRLRSVVEADDLVQEIATSALAAVATAPLDQYSPWQWCQQLARRRVVDAHRFHFGAQRRDAGRQVALQAGASNDGAAGGIEALLAASLTSPSEALSRDVRLSRVHRAILALPEIQREAIRMRYVDGLPTKQIAENLGKTDSAIRVMLSRSLRVLEKELADVRPDRR